MPAESDKHSPRIDEQLQHETSSLVGGSHDEGRDEARRQQAPGPGEPDVGLVDRSLPGDDEHRIDEAQLDERARVAAALAPATFPATRDHLTSVAEAEHLAPELLDRLRTLDAGEVFETVQQVWTALGGDAEGPREQS